MGEATHGGNSLVRNIRLCGCVGVIIMQTDAVDLLVDLSTVVVAVCKDDE